jgi:hypothetical protein
MAEALWHGSDVIAALDTHLLATPAADWQAQGLAIDTR